MSGHSKWSTIKRQKGVADAQRGQVFTKLSKEIIIAAKAGGAGPGGELAPAPGGTEGEREPTCPPTTSSAPSSAPSAAARAPSWPRSRTRATARPGTAVLVEVATDNRNRTVAEVRNVFSRAGGNLGEAGSVAWNFDSRGVITVAPNGKDPDEVALYAIDAGAEDVQVGDGTIDVYTAPSDLEKVKKALEDSGV